MRIEGVLERTQDTIEKRLLSLNELRNIPVLTYKQSDLDSVLKATIKSGIGIAVLLMPPITGNVIQHIRGPVFSNLLIEIQIIEDPLTNKSGISLLYLAETIMRHLHMWKLENIDEPRQLELVGGSQSCQAKREDGKNIFFIRFMTPCHLQL